MTALLGAVYTMGMKALGRKGRVNVGMGGEVLAIARELIALDPSASGGLSGLVTRLIVAEWERSRARREWPAKTITKRGTK